MKTQNRFKIQPTAKQLKVNKTLNYLFLVVCIIIVTCSLVAAIEQPDKFFEFLTMGAIFGLAGGVFANSIKNN